MKVSTKVAAGASLLVGLLVIALVQETALVRQLASEQRMLSEQRFPAVSATLKILSTLESSEERLQKLFVTRDQAYSDKLEALGEDVDHRLQVLDQIHLPPDVRRAADALKGHWITYRDGFHTQRGQLVSKVAPGTDALRARALSQLEAVRTDADSLLSVLRAGIDRDVDRAQGDARRGQRLAWAFAILAVVSGLLFVGLTMRSLNLPLARLIAATRSVATGGYAKLTPRGSDELSELARAFDAMVEQLDEVERTKREFLSHVSHELKTPLAAMQETNQLLIEEIPGALTDKQRRMLQLNLDAGRRLSAMLSRLLDSSRLEAGAVSYDVRPVDVGELLGVAFQEFEAKMRDKQIAAALELPELPAMVHADRDWLVQVFENLLENAIKFSPPERRLWVSLKRAPGDDAGLELPARARELAARQPAVLVTVADEGPGIPAEAKERLFERFFQVKRHARAGNGVGLGLAICRDIVAAHGGVLWAENRSESGSIFAVLLPLLVEQVDKGEESAAERGATAGKEGVARAGRQPHAGRVAGRV